MLPTYQHKKSVATAKNMFYMFMSYVLDAGRILGKVGVAVVIVMVGVLAVE